MPLLSVLTNQDVDPEARGELLQLASQQVSKALGKSEDYFMASLQAGQAMRFGGSEEPAAVFELKALGLPAEKADELTRILCELSSNVLKVEKSRTYVTFENVERGMWGWNDKVF